MLANLISILALLGFVMSLLVHISAAAGVPVHVYFPFVWALHIGIFAVFWPAILISKNLHRSRDFWRALPRPFAVVVGILFAYTFLNFTSGTATMKNGEWNVSPDQSTYTFTPKGLAPEISTRKEYMHEQAAEDKLFSGHWMLFYFVSFALLRTAMVPKRIA